MPKKSFKQTDGRVKSIQCLRQGWWDWSWIPRPLRSVCVVSWFLGVLPFSNSDLNSALEGKNFLKKAESWSLPAVGLFFSAVHLFLTLSSSYLVGRLNVARIKTEWRQGSPLVPRFAMTGATVIHSALAISAGCFAFRRRSTSLALICETKQLIRRAKVVLGSKLESGMGVMGRYSYVLFMAFCMAKAETAMQMLAQTEVLINQNRTKNATESYENTTLYPVNLTSEEPNASNTTASSDVEPAFLADTMAFFSTFFNARWSVPSWVQQAPFIWVQLASIASEGQMTGMCAVLRSSVAALNCKLASLLGKRGRGRDRNVNEGNVRPKFTSKPAMDLHYAPEAKRLAFNELDSVKQRRGWRHWLKRRNRNRVSWRKGPQSQITSNWLKTPGTFDEVPVKILKEEIATKPLVIELCDLRRLYRSMMELHDGINRRFGDELLVNTIGGRLAAVLTLYAGLFIIFDHRYRPSERQPNGTEDRKSYLTLYLLILFFQLLVYISRLIYVCYSCHRVCSAVAKTRVLLQEFKGEVVDINSSQELNIFCAQLESRNVEFSAGGFFAVDLKFLHSILGSLFTYLIILIQFQTP